MRRLGKHIVDRAFEQGLQDAKMPVSSRVWDGISNELEKDKLRKMVFWYRSVAAASVLLLIGLGTWVLTWQAANNKGTADMGLGKSLKGWQISYPERACGPEENGHRHLQSADRKAQAQKSAPRNAWLLGTPIMPFNGQPSQTTAAKKDYPSLEEALRKVPQAMADLRKAISKQPSSLMPDLADRGRRPSQGFEMPEVGEFAELLPPRSPEKRREREFTYAMEDGKSEAKPAKHWELGAGFAPDMTFASTTPLQQGARSSQIIANDPTEANTNRLSPVMAYSTAVRASFELNDRWSLRSGLSYINRQSSTSAVVNTFGKVDAYQSTLNLSSMEIPLAVRFNVIANKHFDYYVTSGVSGTFLLHYDNTQVTSAGKIAARRSSDINDALKPSQGSLLLSTGLKYRIFDRLNLQVEPGIRYGLLTNEYAFSQSRPVSMNLLTGLNYHF